jgi:anti-anti-sigma factor
MTTAPMTTAPVTTTHAATWDIDLRDEVGLSVHRLPAHTIARLRGELDVATAPALRERLAALLRLQMPMPLLVLDLAEVWFCDAAGLAVLIGTQRRATALGTTLRVAAPRSQVARVLNATGLDRSLSIHLTVADALARPRTRHATTAGLPIPRLHPGAGDSLLAAGFTRRAGTHLSHIQSLRDIGER